ncbi:HVO_0234 family beta-propeller protein [Halorubrum sp. DTA46]|uniref:HVO_0234 family beta-propeller protein n=1 Tax=Halorubrum sp. DTA46 TaxID=3402162 RepID=UPI003AAC6625
MAPAEDDISIEEKRVYAGTAGRTDAYVATESGVVRVALSADKVGAFDMVARDPARDAAVLVRDDAPDLVGIATADGLRVAPVDDDPEFEPVTTDSIGSKPLVAVGVHDDAFLVAGSDGEIDRLEVGDEGTDPTGTSIGTVPDPRAVDGPLVAAADGVHRVSVNGGAGGDADRELVSVGLDDVRDVAGSGMPLAAAAAGVYWLGNGWMTALEGDATAVAADGDGHAMAVVDGDLFVHGDEDAEWDAGTWRDSGLPVDERPVALGYGPGLSVTVTDAGTLCVDAGDGWRHQVVGVRGVAGVALAVVE